MKLTLEYQQIGISFQLHMAKVYVMELVKRATAKASLTLPATEQILTATALYNLLNNHGNYENVDFAYSSDFAYNVNIRKLNSRFKNKSRVKDLILKNTLKWKLLTSLKNFCCCIIPYIIFHILINLFFSTRRVKCVLYALRANNSLRILRSSWKKLVYAPRSK